MRWAPVDRYEWHLRFAWLPTQMDGGEWVWLQPYIARYRNQMDWGYYERFSQLPDGIGAVMGKVR